MAEDETPEIEINFSLPRASTADLRGKQSVRATFKLSEKAIDALSIVAIHLGIKQKSLFDHLIEDARSLKVIAKEVKTLKPEASKRIQKTYVLSRRTLSSLDQTSKRFNAPRDALVEYSIHRLLPLIARERERHRRRKAVLKEITAYLGSGEALLEQTRTLLGEDDPVFEKLENVINAAQSAQSSIESFIEKGNIIEDF